MFLRRPHIFIACLRRHQVHARVSAAKQTMQSIAIATVQLTTTETTITYHNALCLSPQDFT